MKSKKPELSVIIPVFNEEKRLSNLEKVLFYLERQKFESELVVVNDGSLDSTENLLKKYYKKNKLEIISYTKNRGKGFAVKTGMLAAKGRYRLFTDLDLSAPIEETEKFMLHIKKNPVVIASRKIKETKLITRQPRIREFMGSYYTYLSQKILGLSISDFTCGFKCFNEDAANNIFSKTKIDRWGFDPEILMIATKLGYKILEVPIIWRHDPNTKVKFPQDIFNSFNELIRVRIYSMRGFYKHEA